LSGKCDVRAGEERNGREQSKVMSLLEKVEVMDKLDTITALTDQQFFTLKNENKIRELLRPVFHQVR
jgi:hypothetical protein